MQASAATTPEQFNFQRLVAFCGLALTISWTLWAVAANSASMRPILSNLCAFGPTVAALIVLSRRPGELPALWQRLLIWRCDIRTYLFVFGITAIGCALALGLDLMINGTGPVFPTVSPVYLPLLVFVFVLLFSVAGEELGWRGYALPELLKRVGPLAASLVLGIIWAIWHLPLFYIAGNFHTDIPIALFGIQIVAFSILYTAVHLRTGGSLLMVHLFHAASNTTIGIFPILPVQRDGSSTALWIAVGFLVVLAIRIGVQIRDCET